MKAENAARQRQKQKQKVVPKVAPPTTSEGSSSSQENQHQEGEEGAEGQEAAGEKQQQVGSGGAGKRGGSAHVARALTPTQVEGETQPEGIGVVEAASAAQLSPNAAGEVAEMVAAAAAGEAVSLQEICTVPAAVSNHSGQSRPVFANSSCSIFERTSSAEAAAALGVLSPRGSLVAGSLETWAIPRRSATAGTTGAGSAAASLPAAADVGCLGPGSLSIGGSSPAAAAVDGGSNTRRAKRVECVVCLDARAEVMLLPCKHTILCQTCAELVREGGKTCPMCRTPVEGEVMVPGVGEEGRKRKGPAVAAAGGTAQQKVVTGESVVTEVHRLPVEQQQGSGSRDFNNAASSSTNSRPCLPDVSGSNLLSSSSSSTTEAAASTSGASFSSGSIALPGVLQQLLASPLSPSRSNLSHNTRQHQQQLQQVQAALPGTISVSQQPVSANQASGSTSSTSSTSCPVTPLSIMRSGNSTSLASCLRQESTISSVPGMPTAVASPTGSKVLPLKSGLAVSGSAGSQSPVPAVAPALSPPTQEGDSYGREAAAAVKPAASVVGTKTTGEEQQQACRDFMREAASLLRQTEGQLMEVMQQHRSRMRELCVLYGVAEEDAF